MTDAHITRTEALELFQRLDSVGRTEAVDLLDRVHAALRDHRSGPVYEAATFMQRSLLSRIKAIDTRHAEVVGGVTSPDERVDAVEREHIHHSDARTRATARAGRFERLRRQAERSGRLAEIETLDKNDYTTATTEDFEKLDAALRGGGGGGDGSQDIERSTDNRSPEI